MHCRAVRKRRFTVMAALRRIGSRSASTTVSRKTLSPHSSCTSADPGSRAASMSTTDGSSSKSTSTSAGEILGGTARVSATQAAMGSPT